MGWRATPTCSGSNSWDRTHRASSSPGGRHVGRRQRLPPARRVTVVHLLVPELPWTGQSDPSRKRLAHQLVGVLRGLGCRHYIGASALRFHTGCDGGNGFHRDSWSIESSSWVGVLRASLR